MGRQQTLGSLVLGSLVGCAFLIFPGPAGFKRARVKDRVLAWKSMTCKNLPLCSLFSMIKSNVLRPDPTLRIRFWLSICFPSTCLDSLGCYFCCFISIREGSIYSAIGKTASESPAKKLIIEIYSVSASNRRVFFTGKSGWQIHRPSPEPRWHERNPGV